MDSDLEMCSSNTNHIRKIVNDGAMSNIRTASLIVKYINE